MNSRASERRERGECEFKSGSSQTHRRNKPQHSVMMYNVSRTNKRPNEQTPKKIKEKICFMKFAKQLICKFFCVNVTAASPSCFNDETMASFPFIALSPRSSCALSSHFSFFRSFVFLLSFL
jgi:hypothetical protein